MSFRITSTIRPAVRAPATPIAVRSFSVAPARMMPAKAREEHKHSPHPKTAPGWKEDDATHSEEAVKADKATGHEGKPDKNLIDKTVEHTHKKHGHA